MLMVGVRRICEWREYFPFSPTFSCGTYSAYTKRLAHRLERETGKAIADYNMIEHGDTVLVMFPAARIRWPCCRS